MHPHLHDPHRPDRGKILIVLHQERSSPGRVGQLLTAAGFQLDIRRPPLGDGLPETLGDHRGAVVFGGPMSANDPDEFVRRETDWLAVPLAEEKPFLGICLGAQMLVNHLGGEVRSRNDGGVEIGWYPIEATEAGRSLMDWPDMVYQFHREGFSLPSGATLLAGADAYPNQAFRYGKKAYGIQFHAELTRAMMHSWVVRGAQRFELPGAQNGHEHLAGRLLWDIKLKRWLEEFLALIFEEGTDARVVPHHHSSETIRYARRDDVPS
jgi:GMP synthase (glutamine-hydrolysing)